MKNALLFHNHLILSSLVFFCSSSLSSASLRYTANTGAGGTDADGFAGTGVYSFTSGGTWNGDGTVQAVVSSPAAPNVNIVTGFSQGAIHFTDVDAPVAGTFVDANYTVTNTITVTGGTADLQVNVTNTGINRLEVLLSAGVTSLQFNTVTSSPVHARSIKLGNNNAHPWMMSARYNSLGTSGMTNADMAMSISNIYTVTDPTLVNDATFGVVGSITNNSQIVGLQNGTYAKAGDSFTYNKTNFGASAQTLGFRHVELDLQAGVTSNVDYRLDPTKTATSDEFTANGLNDSTLSQGEQLYATTHSITLTPNGASTFGENAEFFFTMDGFQGLDTFSLVPVPEPSSILLCGLAGLGLFVRRRA